MNITKMANYIPVPHAGPTTAPRSNMTTRELFQQIYGGGAESASGVPITPESAMRCMTVFACVRVLAESEAQLPLLFYREDAKGNKERDKSYPLYWLLNVQPNPWQSAFEWREMMMGHLALRGNSYNYKVRADNGRITALIPLHPARMEVTQDATWKLHYIHTDQAGNRREYRDTEIMHIRGLTLDGITGVSPISYARDAIGLARATEQTASRLFRNGVHGKGAFKTPQLLDDTTRAQIKAEIAEQWGGIDNAGKPPLLEAGLDWVDMGMSYQDAQYLETRKFQRTDICGMYRVPPHLAGDLERATFSNIEHLGISFVVYTMAAWLRRIEQVITRDLIGPRDQGNVYAEHLVDSLLRGDTLSRYQAHGQAIRDGWLNRNEVRKTENKNQADGLDEFLIPLNMTTSQQVAEMERKLAEQPAAPAQPEPQPQPAQE